jgi:hypothetical protein
VTIAPLGSCIDLGATQQFTATLTNVSSSGLDWYVDGVKNGNSTLGTITNNGLYAAPSSAGRRTVKAVSQADSSLSGSAVIQVAVNSRFSISPNKASVPVAGQQVFYGQTCDIPTTNITWIVDDVTGGNATVGTITSDGTYTAALSAGTHTVTGIDSSQHKSSSTVTVASGIVVDFGSRTFTEYSVPPGVLGVNHVDWLPDSKYFDVIHEAGFTLSRTYANIPAVFARGAPDWTQIDPQMAELQAAGFHVLLQLAFTPAWLQPKSHACGSDPSKAPPADINVWGQLAKAIVAHMDAKFPGVVTDYEIWNEPDNRDGLCTKSSMLDAYLALYAATAPLIKQQAAADGASVRVGGPATSSMNPTWITALLSNGTTAPYVDFVSYHNYIEGSSDVGAAWDVNNGVPSLYENTQDSTTGAAATYARAAQAVAAGIQPLGARTPIYVDEFNTNGSFLKDCCRNDPTYSPVWNALYVGNLLNTVYSGTAQVPAQLIYYSADTHPYFCLVGQWNANMDCELYKVSDATPYPQYYAYQMMASTERLGLNDGAYLAASVTVPPDGADLVIIAFYTGKRDSILIVNPTAQSYSEVVIARNAGLLPPGATLYRVVAGRSISSNALSVTQSGTVYTMTVSIPAYSVLGISMR